MRFGAMLSVGSGSWDLVREEAQLVEASGADVACVGDHLDFPPGAAPLESMTVLGAVAALTVRVELAVVAAAVSFRQPAVLAKQVTALQHVSGGRFRCVLGSGADEREHVAFGLPWGDAADRFSRLREHAVLCRTVWDAGGEPVGLPGPLHVVPAAVDRPASPVRTPLGLAGTSDRVVGLAAAMGDELCVGLVADCGPVVARLRRACDRTGRSVEATAFVPWVPVGSRHPLGSHPRNLAVLDPAESVRRHAEAGVTTLYLVGPGAAAALVERLPDLRAAASQVPSGR